MVATDKLTCRVGTGQPGDRLRHRFSYTEEAFCRLTDLQSNRSWVAQVRDISTDEVGLILPAFVAPGTVLAAEVRGPSWRVVPSFQVQVQRVWQDEGADWRVEGAILQPLTEDQLFRALL